MSGIVTGICVLLALNGVLLHQAWRYWSEYRATRKWPRVETKADDAQLQRVDFVQQSKPGKQTHYEVTLVYRYRAGGAEYTGRTVRYVGSREEAEQLKQMGRVVFFYNPADPTQTVEAIAMPAKLKLIGFLLALVNAVGIWQLLSTWAFYARGQV